MISILCGDIAHPVVPFIEDWIDNFVDVENRPNLYFDHHQIPLGGILFLVSYDKYLKDKFIESFNEVIVIHASDLPKGKGWSPHVWEILSGSSELTLSAIKASSEIDGGDIWSKAKVNIKSTDIFDEINYKLFTAEISLIEKVINMINEKKLPKPQNKENSTYYRKRTKDDSKVELEDKLTDIFNLLRVADPQRYPVYFDKEGIRYNIFLKKSKNEDSSD